MTNKIAFLFAVITLAIFANCLYACPPSTPDMLTISKIIFVAPEAEFFTVDINGSDIPLKYAGQAEYSKLLRVNDKPKEAKIILSNLSEVEISAVEFEYPATDDFFYFDLRRINPLVSKVYFTDKESNVFLQNEGKKAKLYFDDELVLEYVSGYRSGVVSCPDFKTDKGIVARFWNWIINLF